MAETTKVRFDVPIGTWGQTQIEVEYPWHRDLDSIILPLLETAHEQQAERQRKHRSDGHPAHKSHTKKTRSAVLAERVEQTVPPRPNENIKLYLKGFESAKDMTTKRGETFQTILEQYAQQAEKDVERLEIFHKGKHAARGMTPDTDSRTALSCRSTSSSGRLSTSSQSKGDRRRRKRAPGPQDEQVEAERGSTVVADDVGTEESLQVIVPIVPAKSPMRYTHTKTSSWTSANSTHSDKALRLLGIDVNESQHHLEEIDSIVPYQHFASGAVTELDLQPGPSRFARQHGCTMSAVSDKAHEISDASSQECLEQLESRDEADISSLSDSLSPVERRHTNTSRSSSEKALRFLGVVRSDSDPGPSSKQASSTADGTSRTIAQPAVRLPNYPISTTSHAHPEPLSCRRNAAFNASKPVPQRCHSELVGIGMPSEDNMARKPLASDTKRNSLITPFAEFDENDADDVKLITTCSGPQPAVEMLDEGMKPEHAIQYGVRGKVTKRCPRMSGIIENFADRRRSFSN